MLLWHSYSKYNQTHWTPHFHYSISHARNNPIKTFSLQQTSHVVVVLTFFYKLKVYSVSIWPHIIFVRLKLGYVIVSYMEVTYCSFWTSFVQSQTKFYWRLILKKKNLGKKPVNLRSCSKENTEEKTKWR